MHRVWEKERLSYFTIWIGHKFQQGLITILIANLAIIFFKNQFSACKTFALTLYWIQLIEINNWLEKSI